MGKGKMVIRQKTENSFEASVMIDGKRLYRNGRTSSEARKKLKELLEKAKKGEVVTKTAKLADALSAYLIDVKQGKVKATTYDRVESTFNYHIKNEPLGRIQIGEITSKDIQKHLLIQCQKGLSASSIKKIYNLLGEFFRYATATRCISYNPMDLVEMPHASNIVYSEKEMEVLTVEELKRVIEVAEHIGKDGKPDYRYGEAIILLLVTGIRSGELRGIHKDDISLSDGVLHVHQNVVYAKDRINGGIQYIIGDVKTKKSNREIPLNDRAILALQRLMKTTYNSETGYLICTKNGKIVTHSHLQRCFNAILEHANVRHMGLHSTRHTFATVVLKNAEDKGQIKEVSELLGHSQVSTTYEYYIKSSDKEKRKLLNQLGELVS